MKVVQVWQISLQNLNFLKTLLIRISQQVQKKYQTQKKVLNFVLNAESAKLKLTYITVVKKPKLRHSRHFAHSSLSSRSSGLCVSQLLIVLSRTIPSIKEVPSSFFLTVEPRCQAIQLVASSFQTREQHEVASHLTTFCCHSHYDGLCCIR